MKKLLTVLIILAAAIPAACSESIPLDELVGQFANATDIQRPAFEKHFKYEPVKVDAVVKNVDTWNIYDKNTDKQFSYYRVMTEMKTLDSGLAYEIWIFYKDKDAVKALEREQTIRTEASFLKIVDNKLNFSVQVFSGTMTEADKKAFE